MFCEFFLSRIVGITTWKDVCTKSRVSEVATASDEAFAYLLVRNYWETWLAVDLEQYKNEAIFDSESIKKRKGKQILENTPRMHMVQQIWGLDE